MLRGVSEFIIGNNHKTENRERYNLKAVVMKSTGYHRVQRIHLACTCGGLGLEAGSCLGLRLQEGTLVDLSPTPILLVPS